MPSDLLQKAACSLPAIDGMSFFALNQLASSMAQKLQKKGVDCGDRIAVRVKPSIEYIALFFAAWRIGASVCPLSPYLTATQIEILLQNLDVRLFIDAFPIQQPMRAAQHKTPCPGVFICTSGSTGTPKIAFLSLKSLITNAEEAALAFSLQPTDQWLLNLPLYHVSGIGIILRCCIARASITLQPNNSAITHISAVPTQLYRAWPVYQHLRCLLIGGAPITTYPQMLPCYLSYGLTEMGSVVTASFCPPSITLGAPLKGREMRISAAQEIYVKGSCLFQGYWHQGQLHLPLDKEGWFATGDVGHYAQGQLTVLGRKDRQFISGGENIQPEEIECALLEHLYITEACVVPVPDAEYGNRAVAYLQTHRSIDEKEIRNFLLHKIEKYKIPTSFFFLNELPKKGMKVNWLSLYEKTKTLFN